MHWPAAVQTHLKVTRMYVMIILIEFTPDEVETFYETLNLKTVASYSASTPIKPEYYYFFINKAIKKKYILICEFNIEACKLQYKTCTTLLNWS